MNEKKIIIVGGRLTGLYLANILSSLKIHSILIEKDNLHELANKPLDGRVSAISHQSAKIIEKYDLWKLFEGNFCPIEKIEISDNHYPIFLGFSNELVENRPMGYMLENQFVISKLYNNITHSEYVEILDEQVVTEIEDLPEKIIATTSKGIKIEGELLLAANGKFSDIRDTIGIKTYSSAYNQTAMVFNVTHELHHKNTAYEIFMPNGPFAILPMQGGHKSAIVWSDKPELTNLYTKMKKEDLSNFLEQKLNDILGKTEIAGEIFSYPLSIKFTTSYYKGRVCLVGDSAHSMHPIAGQGFNQGIRDIEIIVDLIYRQKRLGLDAGSKIALREYEKSRRLDNLAMIAITDILDKIFSNNITTIKLARRIGLATVSKISKLQKFFMQYAMGER